MIRPKQVIKLAITLSFVCWAYGEDQWVWSQHGDRRERINREDKIDRSVIQVDKFRSEASERSEREREPTTKRPTANSQQDDIDDYADTEPNNLGTRNYGPFGGNGFNAGFNAYPQNISPGFGSGSAANGILVGPGGPTGIIGRPPQNFGGGFGIDGAGPAAGFTGQPQFGQGAGGFNGGYNPAFQAGFGAGGFPGAAQTQNNGLGQYPMGQFGGAGFGGGNAGQFGQYPPGAQYPQYPGGQFQGNQFGGAQYPVGQFGNGQFGGSQFPQYTEGYGLAYTQGYPNNGAGGPFNNFNNPNSFGQGFDAYDTKRKLQVEGKSAANVESRNLVDDKVGKKL